LKALLDWLDDRTGVRRLLRGALYEHIPGGARWRYIWGSTLTFAIFVQFVTGIVLWAAYSPNAQGAWESVYYIQNVMAGGWILRGVHHFMAQAMIVLLALHLMQILIDRAYKAPREVNFWFGLGLLHIVLGLSLTGYLLPWDQKGYWATKVATSIASITPVIGPQLQQILVGGADYGHHTLTRFFALHAGVLPAALVLLVVGHVYLFRRHGVTPPKSADTSKEGNFWPDQVLRDGVAGLVVLLVVLLLVLWDGGAPLGAPADPVEPYAAARPEWYFMFLFQWLKYFPAGWEVVGAHLFPGLVFGVIALMPIIGRWELGHRFNVGFFGALVVAIGLLTWRGYATDAADEAFQAAKEEAETHAERVTVLANAGIPVGGAVELVRNDPYLQGPTLFAQNCASCHTFDGHDGTGGPVEEPEAADLAGFGTRAWLDGLLDAERIGTPEYFGATAHRRGAMWRFVTRRLRTYDEEQLEKVDRVLDAVAAEANPEMTHTPEMLARIAEGRELFGDPDVGCAECHTFGAFTQESDGPVLDGWGSREWILGMIHDPTQARFYGDDNDRMPSFGVDESLTDREMGLITDWLRRDWYEPEVEAAAGAGAEAGPGGG
jgi:ubiquinol-cytochrome c reductase cytochrome b subunit